MKRILVPTDFSTSSKNGIRFAILCAERQDIELVFIHVLNAMIPTRWSQGTVTRYIDREMETCRNRFRKFIDGIYKSMNIKPGVHSIVLLHEHDPAKTMVAYCNQEELFDCICISTNGAGAVRKLFGTTTSALISLSTIPVLAIPRNYKPTEVRSILYSTDFHNYKFELGKVLNFASLFGARVDVVHFAWPGELTIDRELLQHYSGDYEFGLKVIIEEKNASLSLTERLKKMIQRTKPSVVIMFSNKERNLLQKIFLSSQAREMSFNLKTPLLVYSKVNAAQMNRRHELA